MRPTRNGAGALADLIEMILDKGVLLKADLVIQVGGIPLIGIHILALIASIETMASYGIMEDWDASLRESARVPSAGKGELRD